MDSVLSFVPVIGIIVSLTFAFLLLKQYRMKKLPFLAAWALAMVLFSLGFLGETLGLNFGWNQVSAKIYYFFGGILAVGYLSMGTIYLLKPDAAKWIAFGSITTVFLLWIPIFGIKLFKADVVTAAVIVLIYLATIIAIFVASAPRAALFGLAAVTLMAAFGLIQHTIDINALISKESWRDVMTTPLRSGAFALSSAGSFIIIIGAIYSSVTGWSDPVRRPHIYNTIIIAIGVFIAALGGTLHGIFDIGKQLGLSISTTLGIGVMLAGYLRTQKKNPSK